jgi:hypothetical protein
MKTESAPCRYDIVLPGQPLPAASVEKLRDLLLRVQLCKGRDEDLAHDLWWELVDVPTGAARIVAGVREINYTAGDPTLKPFWRAPGFNHFGDEADGPLLIESLDRIADLAGRVLNGWRWQLYSGGGPESDKCFACVYSRFGAFTARQDTLPTAFVAAILEARIALAEAEQPAYPFRQRPPQVGQSAAFEMEAPVPALRIVATSQRPGRSL